ncbi:uncharacterized protein LOC143525753 isoform X5 [Brachyhypopomus gauderio]|uniref:uncharacterized protein LOC143525753 isoform X5 n=1 Tax=Brachyhypopomus gauderio TaxID=698409 RepID=UPI004041B452
MVGEMMIIASPLLICYCILSAFLSYNTLVFGGAEVPTVTSGETVTLKCPSAFKKYYTLDVEWGRDGGILCKYKIKQNSITHYYYCSPQLKENSEIFGLIVTNFTSRDAGLYNCTVTRLIPPPSEDKHSTFKLEVNASLTLQHLNSSDMTCVDLLCSMEGLREEKLNFTWSKADKELLHLHNMSMRNMSSRLRLCEPAWRYGDTLTCHASYANDSVVYSRAITLTGSQSLSCYPAVRVSCFIATFIIIIVMWVTSNICARCKLGWCRSAVPP